MALLHLVHHALGRWLVEVLDLLPIIGHLLHVGDFRLHQVSVAQLGQIPATVEHVLRKGTARVLAETRRALAMNAVLGPA